MDHGSELRPEICFLLFVCVILEEWVIQLNAKIWIFFLMCNSFHPALISGMRSIITSISNPYSTNEGVWVKWAHVTHSGVWYAITRQKHWQDIDPWKKNRPFLQTFVKFGKHTAAILSPAQYLLDIRFISAAWFICTPASSMKCEATEWN